MNVAILLDKLRLAKESIATAERELEEAIASISVAPRAEKVTTSAGVELAFSKLREAQSQLLELEKIVVAEAESPSQ